jgi:hypothetical protein
VNFHSRILLYPLGMDHAQKTQHLYCCMVQTTQRTRVTCQPASSLIRYQNLGGKDDKNTTSSIASFWTLFTELLPGNALIKFVTVSCSAIQNDINLYTVDQ